MPYRGWELDQNTRSALLAMFAPKFPDVIAHHVTLDLKPRLGAPPDCVCELYGHAMNPKGIEALLVSINGQRRRPDGEFYHITWSLDRSAGFKPYHAKLLPEHQYIAGQFPAFNMLGKTFK